MSLVVSCLMTRGIKNYLSSFCWLINPWYACTREFRGKNEVFPCIYSCAGKLLIGDMTFRVAKYIGTGTIPGLFLLHFQTIRKTCPELC